MTNHRTTALGCASLVLAAGTLAAAGSTAAAGPAPATAAASHATAGKALIHTAPSPQRKCKYQGFRNSGSLVIAWKGGAPEKIGGGRYVGLRTGRDSVGSNGDRSSAKLLNAKKGDSAWVEILRQKDRPESWRSGVPCGITSKRHKEATMPGAPKRYYIKTLWYYHSSPTVKNRWMRACGEARGDVKCGKWYDDHM